MRILSKEFVNWRNLVIKGELDLEFLYKYDDNNVALKFLSFHIPNNHLKYSSTYNPRQSNLLREEICQQKSTVQNLQREFSSRKVSLQNYLNLNDLTHVITLFFGINDKILKLKKSIQQKKVL